jgi:hypothetical protein
MVDELSLKLDLQHQQEDVGRFNIGHIGMFAGHLVLNT